MAKACVVCIRITGKLYGPRLVYMSAGNCGAFVTDSGLMDGQTGTA